MRRAWILVAIFAVAFGLRVGVAALVARPLASDEVDYDRLGATLAATGRYSDEGHPTAYRQIGYPVFVALVYAAVGRRPFAVKVVQAACDAGVAILLFLLLAPRSERAAALALAVWALLPSAILHASHLFSESLFTFLIVLFTAGFVLGDRLRPGRSAVAGVVLGISIVVKWIALPFAAALPLLRQRNFPMAPIVGVVAVASLLPIAWVVRNARVMGAPLFSTNMGTNLWIGNHPGATGAYTAVGPPGDSAATGGEVARDVAARRAAFRWIAADPRRFLLLGVKKLAILATSEGELVVGLSRSPADAGPHAFRRAFRAAPLWLHALVSVPYFLVALVGVLGLGTRERDLSGALFIALFASIATTAFVFFGSSRFHFPLLPFLTLFAAEFAAEPRRRLPRLATAPGILAMAVCATLLLVWGGEFATIYGLV